MSLLKKFFSMKQPIYRREMPTWEEIVDHMQDKELSCFADTIVRIILSKDRAKRIIIFQSDHGYYKTAYEEIRILDEDEWNFFCNTPDRYPAYWGRVASSINSKSFYGTEDDAVAAIADSHEYKTYFA